MKEVTWDEFFELFDPEVHDAIRDSLRRFGSEYVVCFECLDMCSSHLGERTAMGVGPKNTYKTLEEVDGKWLHDLPSQRQYAHRYAKVPEEIR